MDESIYLGGPEPRRSEQVVLAKRFREEGHGPRFHGPDAHWDVPVTRDQDHRDLDLGLGKLLLELQSVGFTEADIEDEARCIVRLSAS